MIAQRVRDAFAYPIKRERQDELVNALCEVTDAALRGLGGYQIIKEHGAGASAKGCEGVRKVSTVAFDQLKAALQTLDAALRECGA